VVGFARGLVVCVVSGCDECRGSVAGCCRGCDHAFVMQWFVWLECCFCWVLVSVLALAGVWGCGPDVARFGVRVAVILCVCQK
jgi:hypothetical protein